MYNEEISKELLLIVIFLIIIMLLWADIITDFSTEPHSCFNSSFAINSKVYFFQQKQPVHLPAGSQSGVGLLTARQDNRNILPLRQSLTWESDHHRPQLTAHLSKKLKGWKTTFHFSFFYFVDNVSY